MDPSTFAWLSRSPIAAWVNSSGAIWPTLESIHFVSLCVLVGSLLIIDLRLIGFYRERCASEISPGRTTAQASAPRGSSEARSNAHAMRVIFALKMGRSFQGRHPPGWRCPRWRLLMA